MSRIDKLSILGVRSFDNARSETIQFNTPLTLIVGMNGSGKTTIIECLKYATTGDMPPNATKSGAFIHDPKLCGEKEVLAQVKVGFTSTQGAKMVITRNLQLTVKKTARTTKALDSTLLMNRNGERVTMSSRVAEMNTMIPQYLGVSRAIIDNVIFCHQEDSLWPLSEPSKLKIKFDEIFEAMKYTKAIENIKVLQKKQRENLGLHEKDESHFKMIKEKADQNKKRSIALDEELAELRAQSAELGVQIKEATRKAEEAWQQGETAGMIVGKLEGKRIERTTMEQSVQRLRQNLTEMSDSDEELKTILEQYDVRVQDYQEDLEAQKARYGEIAGEIEKSHERARAKEREMGSYEAQKETYDRQLENRERLVKETARSHNIRGFDLEVDDTQVQAFVERITKMARDQNTAFERARKETKDELDRAQKVLSEISQQKSALNSRKDSSRQTISSNDKKISSLQGDLNNINIDEGGKVALESNLRGTEAKLQSARLDIGSANWDNSIESDEAELRKLDARKEKLDDELIEGTRQAGDTARLDHVKKELQDRQQSLETMIGAHGEKITSVVGQGWTPASVDTAFERVLQQNNSQVLEAEKQRDGTSREMEQLDYKITTCRADLKNKRNVLKTAEATIREAAQCEPSEYLNTINELESSRDYAKTDKDSFARVVEYFESCIKMGQQHNGCRTCTRPFKDEKEVDKMVKAMNKEKEKFQANAKVEKDLADAEQYLQEARSVSSQFETWKRLKEEEIPEADKDEKRLTEKREKLLTRLEEQDTVVHDRQASKRDVEAMSKTVQNIAKYSADISGFEGQIKELTAKQKASGLSRGLEAIKEDIKKTNDESKTVKARRDKSSSDRDRSRTTINKLELEASEVKGKLSKAEYQLKERKSLDSQIEDYKKLNSEQYVSIKSIDQELQGLGPQLSQAQAKHEDVVRRGEDKDRELQADLNKLNGSLSDLKKADTEIKAYIDKGGPEQLARGKREVETLKSEVTRLEQEQSRVAREAKTLEAHLRDHKETKRGIEDNQCYRRDLRQLQAVRAEIAELETHNAEEDKARCAREASKWQMQRNKIAAEQATIVGSIRSKDQQLQQYISDYDTEYRDAGKKYKESHIMVETTKACVVDLGRFSGALDQAIMKYHSVKMEEINGIIQELWSKTYQGTDVDTIMIRSEHENVKTNKSYNYRVVMIKQDAEMDMRGRCSAGQKVLASIIIRLALAECFGTNCGLIALDEPTTNLDRDNIEALARSLNGIIKERQKQKNFQLIVITHDETFLRSMNCSDFADNYWFVSRNDKQKSQIEKQSISEVI